jgi:membrane-associated protein
VVLARFLPIVRTFAPFVAGVSSMEYSKFVWYNVLGAAIWTVLFIGVGFCFGTLPVIQENFSLAVLGIIGVSVLPVIWEVRLRSFVVHVFP